MAYIKNVNSATILGRVGKAGMKSFDNGGFVVNLSVATSKRYKDSNGEWKETPAEWHNITVWNDNAAKLIKKGDIVQVVGKISYNKMEKSDGSISYSTQIVADTILKIDPLKETASSSNLEDIPY